MAFGSQHPTSTSLRRFPPFPALAVCLPTPFDPRLPHHGHGAIYKLSAARKGIAPHAASSTRPISSQQPVQLEATYVISVFSAVTWCAATIFFHPSVDRACSLRRLLLRLGPGRTQPLPETPEAYVRHYCLSATTTILFSFQHPLLISFNKQHFPCPSTAGPLDRVAAHNPLECARQLAATRPPRPYLQASIILPASTAPSYRDLVYRHLKLYNPRANSLATTVISSSPSVRGASRFTGRQIPAGTHHFFYSHLSTRPLNGSVCQDERSQFQYPERQQGVCWHNHRPL